MSVAVASAPDLRGMLCPVHHTAQRLLPIRVLYWQRFHAKASFPISAIVDIVIPRPAGMIGRRGQAAIADATVNRQKPPLHPEPVVINMTAP